MATIDNISATAVGDAITISGTVDGVTYEVKAWKSHLDGLGTKVAKRAYVASRLKAAADAAAVATIDLSGAPIVL